MSLDGFIAGPNESPDNGLGDGSERLHEWSLPDSGGDLETTFVNQLEALSLGIITIITEAEGWDRR